LINSSVQDFSVSSGTWVSLSPNNIEISQNNVAFVKFIVLNPNSFPIFIDDWSIKESGKVILQENHYYPYGKEIVTLCKEGNPEHDFKYNGIEKSEEFNWNNYTAQYRSLSEDFPRWGQVDPKPTYDQSPYMSMGGNPLLYSDFLGDTVRVDQASADAYNQAIYDELGFNNEVNYYQNAVDEQMAMIRSTTEGAEWLQELENSENVFTIKYEKGEMYARASDESAAQGLSNLDANGNPMGSGGTIFYDPKFSSGDALTDQMYQPDKYGFAHELIGHGIDYNRGTLNNSIFPYEANGQKYEGVVKELTATHRENVIIARTEGSFRHFYTPKNGTPYKTTIESSGSVRSVLPQFSNINYLNLRR
jgi:hypothetical protein